MEIHVCVLIVFLLGFGVEFTTQITKIEPELSEKKCYIKEIESFYPNGCFGVEEDGHTVRHQGWCIVGDDQRLTCVHGHWSGTDSSVELLQRNKRFWSIIGGAMVTCIIFCGKRSGGRTPIKYRPSFPRPCTPKDIKGNYNVGAGDNSAVVRWTVPSATDRDGGTPRVIQVDGGINGGRFHGTTYGKVHHIKYKATDSDGLSAYCDFSFSITVLTCNLLPWPANGARKCDNSNILGSTCHYTCNNGYKLTGTSKVTCENAVSPSWSAIPTCDKMTCSEPKYPSHSTVMCSDSNYGYQSICIFKCDSGYALKGARHIQCQADGKWSNYEVSSCIDDTPPTISCVTPQIFYADRGVTTTSVNWQLPTASDTTDDNPSIVQTYGPTMGSVLEVGTEIVKYKAVDVDGSESQECFIQLRIEEITCGHPLESFTDDYMRFNCSTPKSGYVYGASCLLSCIAHLPLEGRDLITCEDNGQSEGVWRWGSGGKPFCRDIACPELDGPINGALTHDSLLTRPLRIMMCNDQFDIPDMGTHFHGYFLCTDNGKWVPFSSVPDCIVPRDPTYVKLPAEIFYYGGKCGENDTIAQIKENFQTILEIHLNPLLAPVCPSGAVCIAEHIKVTCGPVQNRRKRSLSLGTLSRRSQENEASTTEHHSKTLDVENHLLVVEFHIKMPINANTTKLKDTLKTLDDVNANILKPTVQDLINNGTFDIKNFKLTNGSFVTANNWETACDSGYIPGQTICKPCPIGYFLNETSNKCDQCPAGQYKDKESETTCSICPSGFTTLGSGSKSRLDCVKQCRPGTYSPNTVETCSTCPLGYYQDKYGQTSCKQCPSGTTTVATNSSSADDCKTYDACMSSPCNGNNCTNIDDSYICTCHGGWSGTNCTTPPDYCADNACENGATCISASTYYTCSCVSGYSGLFCEISQLDKLDGGWSEWVASACSKTCGAGSMNRTRQCNSPVPGTNGSDCAGDATETIACNMDACPVCKELRNTSGTVLDCTTDEATGSKTCTIYCEDGKVLPPGLIDEESFTCGPSTNYEWGYLENSPSCVDPISPGSINITVNIEYVIEIPDSVASRFVNLIKEQILTVPCFDSISCHTHIEIDKSDMAIVFNIPISRGTDIEYSGYILSGIRNGVLKEAIDAINNLEKTAQYIQNDTNKLFDVMVDNVTYTVKNESLKFVAGVMCNGGFVPYGGFCVTCPVGTHSIDDMCTFCEKGQYQSDAGQASCIPCPSGQTTNTIGSTDSTQCIVTTSTENRTAQPDLGTIPGGGDDTINVMMLASVVSVLALVVAIAAVCVVCYKKISSKSSVAGPSINLRRSTARTRFIRNGRRTPGALEVTPISECHRSDTIRIYDDIRSSESYYARILSYDSMYLTPGSTCMRCSDPPPPYDLAPAQYTDKEYNDVDNTYAVIDDNISTAEKI